MPRRRKNALESAFILVALIVGGIGLAIAKAVDSIGGVTLLLLCVAAIGAIVWSKHQLYEGTHVRNDSRADIATYIQMFGCKSL